MGKEGRMGGGRGEGKEDGGRVGGGKGEWGGGWGEGREDGGRVGKGREDGGRVGGGKGGWGEGRGREGRRGDLYNSISFLLQMWPCRLCVLSMHFLPLKKNQHCSMQ